MAAMKQRKEERNEKHKHKHKRRLDVSKQLKRKKSAEGQSSKIADGVMKEKRKRTKFEQYLEMETRKNVVTAEDDLSFEKQLAKKLKVKQGRLKDTGDGLMSLLDGISDHGGGGSKFPSKEEDSSLEESGGDDYDEGQSSGEGNDQEEDEGDSSDKEEDEGDSGDTEEDEGPLIDAGDDGKDEGDEGDEEKDSGLIEVETGDEDERSMRGSDREVDHARTATAEPKYVPPHQRVGDKSRDEVRLKRRARGLLNRISEDNVESITSELSDMFQVHGRRVMTEIVTNHILEACSSGPRGNEQYAAVFAAFISGIASLVGMDFGAMFMAGVASCFEEQYAKLDSLAVRNVTLLICSLYNSKLISSDLVYDLLKYLCGRFQELDVATILQLIQSCGMGLRSSDPSSMKEFILSVQQRTTELKRSSTADSDEGIGKRVEFMLEAICEVKNNKRRLKDEPVRHSRMKKWLQKLRVEDVQLHSVTWEKLLDPRKKGHWWLGTSQVNPVQDVSNVLDLMDAGAAETEKMLKLAASQRMNTDGRRAVFSIVMSSEDYVDAFEKLLRLNLNGKQDREIVRVVVECCLQEKVFNKYYALLASKLCHHDKNHKFTLQYCIWDHFKELPNMEMRRSVNLAKLLAFLIGSSALSLTTLKAVDFCDSRSMTPKHVVHFRAFFEALLMDNSDEFILSAFIRIAGSPELATLQDGLSLFLRQHVQRKPASGLESARLLATRCQLARKALASGSI